MGASLDVRLGTGLSAENMTVSNDGGGTTIAFNDGAESMTFEGLVRGVSLTFADGRKMTLESLAFGGVSSPSAASPVTNRGGVEVTEPISVLPEV